LVDRSPLVLRKSVADIPDEAYRPSEEGDCVVEGV